MMNILKPICLSVCLLWLPCGTSYAQQQTVEMSLTDLTILEQNCTAQEAALQQSMLELEAARQLLTQSEQEMTELLQELSNSEDICAELRQELAKLKVESVKLKSELSLLKISSVKASQELAKAEQSLNAAEKAYKKDRKKQVRQTRIWQMIAVVLGGVAIAR